MFDGKGNDIFFNNNEDQIEQQFNASFIVLQGTSGDGMQNTIDVLPELSSQFIASTRSIASNRNTCHDFFNGKAQLECSSAIDSRALTSSPTSVACRQDFQNLERFLPSHLFERDENEDDDDSLVEIKPSDFFTDKDNQYEFEDFEMDVNCEKHLSLAIEEGNDDIVPKSNGISDCIAHWEKKCREHERESFEEAIMDNISNERGGTQWWQRNGKLLVLSTVPRTPARLSIIGDLAPGTLVRGVELITYHPEESLENVFHESVQDRENFVFLKIQEPITGFILYSKNEYTYLGRTSLLNPSKWFWRVQFNEGAIVREGKDLYSASKSLLPYGSLIPVTAKSMNDDGLIRLKVYLSNASGEGWVSEILNPLAGKQRGKIIRQLPLPVPVLYRVIAKAGVWIKDGKEESSASVRIAPYGAILKITGREFSNFPTVECIQKLRLAGGDGWISLKEGSEHTVEFIGIDRTFDPNNPGLYHIDAMLSVRKEMKLHSELSSYDRSLRTLDEKNGNNDDLCMICLTEERSSTLVHGETGHIVCCIGCARILKAKGDPVSNTLLISFRMKSFFPLLKR